MAHRSQSGRAQVAAVRNDNHSLPSLRAAVHKLLDHAVPPIGAIIKRGDRVLLKVNMGCSGMRSPEDRVTTHPALVEAIIELLHDCGALVSFGDDVARVGRYCPTLWKRTGMSDVAQRTGATLIDFVASGGREVRGGLLYPRSYLVTNAYFETDVVINAANCRSHPNIVLSGAIKNMFGCVLGTRKQLMHELFWDNPSSFGRAIADIHQAIPADFSILDLTSVREGEGIPGVRPDIRKVGLLLASTDPVALDSVAAYAIGYEQLPIWTTYHANRMGVGESDVTKIMHSGLQWPQIPRTKLRPPLLLPPRKKSFYEMASNLANHTLLRPRPVITHEVCTRCGECVERCPVHCIEVHQNVFEIKLRDCADCGCCMRLCEENAITLQHVGTARLLRECKDLYRSRVSRQSTLW